MEAVTPENKLDELLRYWQQEMGLSEWQIWIRCVEPGEYSSAHIAYDAYHYQATINVNEDHPEDQWDHTIVHELLHLLLEPAHDYIDELLEQIDPRERKILKMGVERVIEPLINRLAQAIVGKPRPYMEFDSLDEDKKSD